LQNSDDDVKSLLTFSIIIIIILMGAIQAKFTSSSKESELPSEFGDSAQDGSSIDLKAQSSTLSLDAYSQKKHQLKLFEVYRLLR
jgi:hypothetical protein